MTGRTTLEMAREAGLYVHKEVQPEIRRFEELVRADEATKWSKGLKINVPTSTMEYEFARHYDRGYRAGQDAAFKRLHPDDTEGGEP